MKDVFSRILEEYKHLLKAKITVGVHAEEGSALYPGTSTNVATVAAAHEFGTDKIPKRPFLRQAVKEHEKKWRDYFASNMGEDVFDKLAEKVLSDTLGTFDKSSRWAEPLKKSTILKKGHSTPLLETGRLRDSIKTKVHK